MSKNCGRTFYDKTGTSFAHSKLTLTEWYFTIYVFLRFNTSLRQIEAELDLSYRMVRRHIERSNRARGPVHTGRGWYDGDKPPVFMLVARGSGERYVVPAKSTEESTVRLLLAVHDEEALTVYTGGFRPYGPLDDPDEFDREYVNHGNGDYADGEEHVNGCENAVSLARW